MGEMTFDRAAEIMTEAEHLGLEWEVSECLYSEGEKFEFVGTNGERVQTLDEFTGLAVAEKLERDFTPPADAGAPAKTSLRSQVLALAGLEAGWLDGQGEAYDPARLAAVADVLDRLAGIAGAGVCPTGDGRISVEWHNGRRTDSLEIDPATLAARLHLYDLDTKEAIVGEIGPESLAAKAATRKVLGAFLRPEHPHWDGLASVTVTAHYTTAYDDATGEERLTFGDLRAAIAENDMEVPR